MRERKAERGGREVVSGAQDMNKLDEVAQESPAGDVEAMAKRELLLLQVELLVVGSSRLHRERHLQVASLQEKARIKDAHVECLRAALSASVDVQLEVCMMTGVGAVCMGVTVSFPATGSD